MGDYAALEAENKVLRRQLYFYRLFSLVAGFVIVLWFVIRVM